jgi:hypothetical protein
MNKRNLIAVFASAIVFYVTSSLLIVLFYRYMLILNRMGKGFTNIDIWVLKNLPAVGYSFYLQSPFIATEAVSAFLSGVAGTLILKQKKYMLVSAPVLILSLISSFYFIVGARQYPELIIVSLLRNLTSLLSVVLGIWVTAKIKSFPLSLHGKDYVGN